MSFSRIFGHGGPAKIFQNALEEERLGHAYGLFGPRGVGKFTFALEVAKAANCLKRSADACDTCSSCGKIERGNHPDVTVVRAASGKRSIEIRTIRSLIHEMGLQPMEGKRKVFIIDRAEQMTVEAANALLKTLEEPPPRSLLLLCMATLEALPPTVLSRCQMVHFFPLSADLIEKVLRERGTAPERASFLARISMGSLGGALERLEEEIFEKKDEIIGLVYPSADRDATEQASHFVELLTRGLSSLEAKRSALLDGLRFLLFFFRDLLILQGGSGAPEETIPLYNEERRGELCREAGRLSEDRLVGILDHLFAAEDQLCHNANLDLAVEVMVSKIYMELKH
jgi:DNA polymerase-3 subunit delta'